MVPVFGVLVLFVIYFLPSLGNGPFWKERILREVDYCSSSWWTVFLGLSNYIQEEKQVRVFSTCVPYQDGIFLKAKLDSHSAW